MDPDQQPPTSFPNMEDPPAEPDGNASDNLDPSSEDLLSEGMEPAEEAVEFPKSKPRTAEHNITVRSGAKLFESKSHPITERTIINWCSPTKTGPAKLDCAWDEVQSKYFITQQSIEQAMADMRTYPSEPLPKLQKDVPPNSESDPIFQNEPAPSSEELQKGSENLPTNSESFSEASPSLQAIKALSKEELETQLFESRFTSRLKDSWYESRETQHQADISRKDDEHAQRLGQVIKQVKEFVDDLGETKRLVGKLEEQLLQIEGPKEKPADEKPEAGNESD